MHYTAQADTRQAPISFASHARLRQNQARPLKIKKNKSTQSNH
jgi:hypothetical protein